MRDIAILQRVTQTYHGSDGDKTKALYDELRARGANGIVAMNLFRACKNSFRAKKYRGGIPGRGSYRGMAYERKQWAIGLLCEALTAHSQNLGIPWGWGLDRNQEVHAHVLYVDLPAGQVSFHTGQRGAGPDYPHEWDGVRGAAPDRICAYCADVLERVAA